MAFHLGSLGFLTPFKFEDFRTQVTHVLEGHAALTLRSRLRCILIKKEEEQQNLNPSTNQLVLNEVVIDRGPSPYLSNCINADWQHCVRCGRRRQYDPSVCAYSHGHTHLPTFAVVPANCCAGRRRP